MISIKKIFYETISGPLRNLKSLLLISYLFFSVVLFTFFFLFEFSTVGVFLSILYVILLLILSIILLLRLSAKMNDLHYELSLHTNLQSLNYDPKDFYFDGAAGNPSLLLLLMKCLRFCQPSKILELGSGQTTKLLAYYYRDNPNTYVLTLEHNKYWSDIFVPYITHNEKYHDYRFSPLKDINFKSPGTDTKIQTKWFDIGNEIKLHKFNLILVDGPNMANTYSRSGFLQYLPDILDEKFIIIFDDAERYGEIMTINLLKALFNYSKIDFVCFEVNGIKRQLVFCSNHYKFLQYS
jgi:hypothetical protein